MIQAFEQTRNYNRFIDVAIPRAKDLYQKYGERLSSSGLFTTTPDESTTVLKVGNSVIQDMIMAQQLREDSSQSGEDSSQSSSTP